MRFRILEKRFFRDFLHMVNELGTDSLLPGKDITREEAANVYRGFGEKYIMGEKKYTTKLFLTNRSRPGRDQFKFDEFYN